MGILNRLDALDRRVFGDRTIRVISRVVPVFVFAVVAARVLASQPEPASAAVALILVLLGCTAFVWAKGWWLKLLATVPCFAAGIFLRADAQQFSWVEAVGILLPAVGLLGIIETGRRAIGCELPARRMKAEARSFR